MFRAFDAVSAKIIAILAIVIDQAAVVAFDRLRLRISHGGRRKVVRQVFVNGPQGFQRRMVALYLPRAQRFAEQLAGMVGGIL